MKRLRRFRLGLGHTVWGLSKGLGLEMLYANSSKVTFFVSASYLLFDCACLQ